MPQGRDSNVGVGIVGAGAIATHHLHGYVQTPPHGRVVAVADVDVQRAQRLADQAGGAAVFADYHELIASPSVDAIDICLPHHLHKDAIVSAAAAGKHVLCEKPLCITLEEAAEVTDAVARAGITLMCAHNQLFLPPVATAFEMIRAGKLGTVLAARTTDVFVLPIEPERLAWRARRATSGGGELLDTGYHPTYLLLHLVGAQPLKVAAVLRRHRLTLLEGEDSAHVLVEFAGGAVGEIWTSWAYAPPASTERFSVVGDAGSLWSDGNALHFKPHDGTAVVVREADATKTDTYAVEVIDFIACLRDGRRPLNTEIEGVEVLKVILGAYASADRGEIVELKNLQGNQGSSGRAATEPASG